MSFATFPASLPYFKELHDNDSLDQLIKGLSSHEVVTGGIDTLKIKENHPFMEAFETTANYTLTTNGALTNATTRDSIIDFYYGIQAVDLRYGGSAMYEKAWNQDPDMTMHIIFYARSIHRGKSVTSHFFKAYGWLLKNHPRTALANLHVLVDGTIRTGSQLAHWRKTGKKKTEAESDGWDVMDEEVEEKYELLERRDFKTHGYWKDLCTLLTIYCQGELDGPANRNYLALDWPRKKFDGENYSRQSVKRQDRYERRKRMDQDEAKKDGEKYIYLGMKHNEEQKGIAQQQRRDTRVERRQKVVDLLEKDNTYRALHFTIARLFADQLKKDLQQVEKNRVMVQQKKLRGKYALGFNVSLAAKWAPSLGASHDKHTLLATTIAELLFPPQDHQELGESREHYLNKARELYRKQYLAPLRRALDLTEHYMEPGKWEKVDLGHAPSVCLQNNMKYFLKHATDHVIDYMEAVAVGKKKVSGETLGVHQLVHRFRIRNTPTAKLTELFSLVPGLEEKYRKVQEQLLDGQWNTLIQSLRDTSLLKSSSIEESKRTAVNLGECIAICDVSGSMKYNKYTTDPELMPLNAAVGLSLVITNLAKPPFNGAIITFSRDPKTFMVDTSAPFHEQANTILRSPKGFNTDIAKVFTDVLLPMAKKHNLAPEDMVKKLFIFSDMEFDAPHCRVGEFNDTTQEFIRQQFREAGYEMPEIVWWNLCADGTYSSFSEMNAPVTKDDVDVALLSGFSVSMLKTFLDGDIYEGDKKEENAMDVDEVKEKEEGAKTEKKEKEVKEKETVMGFVKRAVYHESFSKIVVVD